MIEAGNNFEEIRNSIPLGYAGRIRNSFLTAFILATIGSFVVLMVKGFSIGLLCSYIFLLILSLIYIMFSVKRILRYIRFYYDQGNIEIAIDRYNSCNVLTFNKKEIKIIAAQDLSAKLTVWRLKVARKTGEVIINQKDISGWTKESFLEIERCYKKISTT